jgi:hypothetical protein
MNEAREDAERGRLSRAIGAYEPEDASRWQVE